MYSKRISSTIVFLILIAALTINIFIDYYILDSLIFVMCMMGIILIVLSLFYKMKTGSILNFINLFNLSYFFFLFGQSIIYVFNIGDHHELLYRLYGLNSFTQATTYAASVFICYNIGIVIAIPNKEVSKFKSDNKVWFNVGIVLYLISVIPMILQVSLYLYNYFFLGFSYSSTYRAINSYSPLVNYILIFSNFFLPSIIILQLTVKSKIGNLFVFSQIFILFIYYFLIGDRTPLFSILFIELWIIVFVTKKVRLRLYYSLIFILPWILIIVIPTLSFYRNSDVKTLVELLNYVQNNSIREILFYSFKELGFSIYSLINVMILKPTYINFSYGESYFFSILALIPNLTSGTHISVEYSALGQWLQEVNNLRFGPGFSIPAELYYNFGSYGIFLAIPIGFLLGKGLYLSISQSNISILYIKILTFYVLFTYPRRETLSIVRDLEVLVVVPIVIFLVLYTYMKRNDLND